MEETTISKIVQWVLKRNIHTCDPRVMLCKTMEELGELASAINKNNMEKVEDSIGDVIVTLVGICTILKLDINDCIDIAYEEIKDRKGELIDGLFVKESDLK